MRSRMLMVAGAALVALTACGGGPPPIPAASSGAITAATAVSEVAPSEATSTAVSAEEPTTVSAEEPTTVSAEEPAATTDAATTETTAAVAAAAAAANPGEVADIVRAFLDGAVAETSATDLRPLVGAAYGAQLDNGQPVGDLLGVQSLPKGYSVADATPAGDGVMDVAATLHYETGFVERVFKLTYQEDTQQWVIADIADPTSESASPPAAEAPAAAAEPSALPALAGTARPITPAACEYLRAAMASKLQVEVIATEALFNDNAGVAGTSCQLVAKGNGTQFKAVPDVALDLGAFFTEQGWTPEMSYAADGSTGTRVGYRKDNSVALISVGWTPVPDVTCEGPIQECKIPQEQRLFTVTIEVADVES